MYRAQHITSRMSQEVRAMRQTPPCCFTFAFKDCFLFVLGLGLLNTHWVRDKAWAFWNCCRWCSASRHHDDKGVNDDEHLNSWSNEQAFPLCQMRQSRCLQRSLTCNWRSLSILFRHSKHLLDTCHPHHGFLNLLSAARYKTFPSLIKWIFQSS